MTPMIALDLSERAVIIHASRLVVSDIPTLTLSEQGQLSVRPLVLATSHDSFTFQLRMNYRLV